MLCFHCFAPQDQEPGSWGQSDRRSDGPKRSAWRDGTNVHNTEGAPTPPQLFLWQPIFYIMLCYVVIYTYVHAGMLYPDPAWVNYIGGGRRTPQNHQQDWEITEARTNLHWKAAMRLCTQRVEGGEGEEGVTPSPSVSIQEITSDTPLSVDPFGMLQRSKVPSPLFSTVFSG